MFSRTGHGCDCRQLCCCGHLLSVPVVETFRRKTLTCVQYLRSGQVDQEVQRLQGLYELCDLPITKLTTERIELARNQHLATRKAASANHWLRYMKLLVNWAVKRKIIAKLSWDVPMQAVQKVPSVTLPTKRTADWFDAIDKASRRRPSVALAVHLMYGLAMRESEAATARWEWIDFERRTYTPGITKGKEAVPIPMPAWLIAQRPTSSPFKERRPLRFCLPI